MRRDALPAALVALLLVGSLPTPARDGLPLVLVLEGEADDDHFGYGIAGTGDVDGDGWVEWLVAAHDWGPDENGKLYLYRSAPPLDGDPDRVIEGTLPHEHLGTTVAGVGDVNGDGFADFAARDTVDDPSTADEAVRLVLGAPDLSALSDLVLHPGAPFCYGYGVSITAGDLNGDGFSDVVVGAFDTDRVVHDGRSTALDDTTLTDDTAGWGPGTLVGYALIPNVDTTLFGFWPYYPIVANTATTITVPAATPGLTYSAAAGDRYSVRDYRKGSVRLYLGSSEMDAQADLELHGEQSSSFFGFAVAAVGDVDGNGCDDLLVGAYEDDQAGDHAGRAYLYLGRPDLPPDLEPAMVIPGPFPGAALGMAVSAAGDFNRDGWPDFAVGLPRVQSTLPGQVWLYWGGPGLDPSPDLVLEEGDSFGLAIAALGDVDGDGVDDLGVGSPHAGDGEVRVYLGSARPDPVADGVLHGEPGGYDFGLRVAPLGDVDRDGRSDLLVATYDGHVGNPPPYNGKAFLYAGAELALIFRDGFESGSTAAWTLGTAGIPSTLRPPTMRPF